MDESRRLTAGHISIIVEMTTGDTQSNANPFCDARFARMLAAMG